MLPAVELAFGAYAQAYSRLPVAPVSESRTYFPEPVWADKACDVTSLPEAMASKLLSLACILLLAEVSAFQVGHVSSGPSLQLRVRR